MNRLQNSKRMEIKSGIQGFLLLIVLSVSLLVACDKDQVQGEASLKGSWVVNEIESIYADFDIEEGVVRGIGDSEKETESGNLGFFNFSDSQVTYEFTRNDTLVSGEGAWELKLAEVNQGFFKVNEWTLIIGEDFVFDVRFEDETKNAEKNANSVEFDNWPKSSGNGVAFFLKLEKQ